MHLGPWLLEERLARGGMAEVWRGRKANRKGKAGDDVVCIKRLDPGLTNDPDFVEMFRDEARLVLGLDHENVVKTYALYDDNPGGQPQELLLVMELIDGPSLARLGKALEHQQQPPASLAESLTIVLQLARALHHVHKCFDDGEALAIVHRDVSPQNLLVDRRGRVVLIDFGVARAASRLTLTRKGTLKGKAAYMAPEQVRGDVPDARVDQFATGVVLWELLCHRPLFAGTNELRVLEQIERAEVVPPSIVASIDPRVAKDVDAVVLKALAFNKEQRFSDMAAFASSLASILDVLGGPADLVPLVQRGLAAIETSGQASEQPTRTRVMKTDPDRTAPDGSGDDDDDDDAALARSRARARSGSGALVLGALVVSAVVGVAVMAARSGGEEAAEEPVAVVVEVDRTAVRAAALEVRLHKAPSHPCRTELLDEILDRQSLGPLLDAVAVDVEACVAVAAGAPALRELLEKKRLLEAPVLKRKASAKQKVARLNELTRRARLALDAGRSDVARAFLEEVVSADPARIDEKRLLAEAYRREGELALAAVELRAFLKERPLSPERPRLVRWMKKNDLPL
ncbi:MAG: protein kinase [Deltaproteobacteria bacterium]|nr:protein kinase [Deltaproteobacteria bacterium]